MKGPTSATPKGTTYTYHEPAHRIALLRQFVAKVDVPGKVFHTLDCTDSDVCQVE